MLRKDPSHAKSPRKPLARQGRENDNASPYERLEARHLLAVAQISLKSGLLSIVSDNSATELNLSSSGSKLLVTDQMTGRTWKYTQSKVTTINFQGGLGNDKFFSLASGIPVTARGGAGNDQLRGGNGIDQLFGEEGDDTLYGLAGNDSLVGGYGNDVLVGGAGDDQVWGDLGNDWIYGGGGNDRLSGDNGDDRLFGHDGDDILWGGEGNDTLQGAYGDDQLVGGLGDDHLNGQGGVDRLWGQEGADTLVGIDNLTSDYLEGGSGNDVIWRDSFSAAADFSYGNDTGDTVQSVSRFDNGADLTLDGDRIADPTLHDGLVFKNFSGPLFSSQGPQFTDTVQGSLGDCYLIAGLGAMAYDQPRVLKANMVDFNDGTYGVRYGNEFFRVDGDLPAYSAYSTTPAFAQLGAEESLWVAIAEKAFAHYRTTAESYKAIEYGWQKEVFIAFNAIEVGHYSFAGHSSGSQIAYQLYTHWALYQAACVGFVGYAPNTYGLVMNHAYMVHSFTWNSAGTIASVTIRNPWGKDGSNRDSNPNDGLVTLTTDELFALRGNGWINYGRFA